MRPLHIQLCIPLKRDTCNAYWHQFPRIYAVSECGEYNGFSASRMAILACTLSICKFSHLAEDHSSSYGLSLDLQGNFHDWLISGLFNIPDEYAYTLILAQKVCPRQAHTFSHKNLCTDFLMIVVKFSSIKTSDIITNRHGSTKVLAFRNTLSFQKRNSWSSSFVDDASSFFCHLTSCIF